MFDRFLKGCFIFAYGLSQVAVPVAMFAICLIFIHFSENEPTPRRSQA